MELDGAREQYLTLLLDRFEKGGLEPYEYTSRVRAIELATTVDRMAQIVEAPVSRDPRLDAVDMAILARQAAAAANLGKSSRGRRMLWPALLAFLFVILLVVGLWLAGHAKALHNSGGSGVVVARALATVALGT
ncbi:MAG: hypothetical protein ACYDD4_12475 [Acidimicrobiales bacterium]